MSDLESAIRRAFSEENPDVIDWYVFQATHSTYYPDDSLLAYESGRSLLQRLAMKFVRKVLINEGKGIIPRYNEKRGIMCPYLPRCTDYMYWWLSINIVKGLYLAIKRNLRCHPGPGGYGSRGAKSAVIKAYGLRRRVVLDFVPLPSTNFSFRETTISP